MVKTKMSGTASFDRRWQSRWQAYMDYMEKNKRRPSKYYDEDKGLVNWYKHSKKLQNKGLLPQERQQAFNLLIQTAQKYRRLNQYSYAASTDGRCEGFFTTDFT